MTDVRRTVTCSRCHEDFSFNQVRYLSDGKMACFVCLGIEAKEKQEEKQRGARQFTYQCLDCRYKFSRSASVTPKVCPECGNHEFVKYEAGKLDSKTVLEMADDPRLSNMDRVKDF